MRIADALQRLKAEIPEGTRLVAVSKTKPISAILEAYEAGQRDFGENYVQELVEKQAAGLPDNLHWHFIGHLQRNKVKYIASFVHLIHGVDSLKLLQEIDKQAQKNERIIDVLLQVHIAREESKFGFDEKELSELTQAETFHNLAHVRVRGLMGMASNTSNLEQVTTEFRGLYVLFNKLRQENFPENFDILSMGMSGDYKLAIEEGSTMVRIGSLIFGSR